MDQPQISQTDRGTRSLRCAKTSNKDGGRIWRGGIWLQRCDGVFGAREPHSPSFIDRTFLFPGKEGFGEIGRYLD